MQTRREKWIFRWCGWGPSDLKGKSQHTQFLKTVSLRGVMWARSLCRERTARTDSYPHLLKLPLHNQACMSKRSKKLDCQSLSNQLRQTADRHPWALNDHVSKYAYHDLKSNYSTDADRAQYPPASFRPPSTLDGYALLSKAGRALQFANWTNGDS